MRVPRPANLETEIASDSLSWRFGLQFAGFLGLAFAAACYPPVDSDFFWIAAIALFFVPGLPYLLGYFTGKLPGYLPWLRPFMTISGIILILVAILVYLNATLDSSLPTQYKTVLREKIQGTARRNRGSREFIVDSWRTGRDREKLQVQETPFLKYQVGDPVVANVRRGKFGLPWYDNPVE